MVCVSPDLVRPTCSHVWTTCSVETLGIPAITFLLILLGFSFSLRDVRLGSIMALLSLVQWGPSNLRAQAQWSHLQQLRLPWLCEGVVLGKYFRADYAGAKCE